MDIFVRELPKSCDECPCCNSDVDYGACCNLGAYGYVDYYPTTRKHPNCPLKTLTDRLVEERKKVVKEAKKLVVESTCYDTEEEARNHLYDLSASEVLELLDQIEENLSNKN